MSFCQHFYTSEVYFQWICVSGLSGRVQIIMDFHTNAVTRQGE